MATQNDIKAQWFDRISELMTLAINQQETLDSMKREIAQKDAQIQTLQKPTEAPQPSDGRAERTKDVQ